MVYMWMNQKDNPQYSVCKFCEKKYRNKDFLSKIRLRYYYWFINVFNNVKFQKNR